MFRVGLPYPRNPHFLPGANAPLLDQHVGFLPGQGETIQIRVLTGLCGIGKTQLANEYVYRYAHHYALILWLNASSHQTLQTSLRSVAHLEAGDGPSLYATCKQWLQKQSDWLVVLDQIEDYELVEVCIPQAFTYGHVLLTTRWSATGTYLGTPVEPMDNQIGALFLLRRAHLLSDDALLDQADPALVRQASAIAEEYAGLPLALDQAAASLETTEGHLAASLASLLPLRAALWRERGRTFPGDTHPESLRETFTQVYRRLSPAARELLRLFAFVPRDLILSATLLQHGEKRALPSRLRALAAHQLSYGEAIADLQQFSLLRFHPQRRQLRMHPVVAAIVRDRLTSRQRQAYAALAAALQQNPAEASGLSLP
jgi:hypothetical protein